MYGSRERMSEAIAKLDQNGWNTEGRISTTTWLWASAMLSPIREWLLELSLSVNSTFTRGSVE